MSLRFKQTLTACRDCLAFYLLVLPGVWSLLAIGSRCSRRSYCTSCGTCWSTDAVIWQARHAYLFALQGLFRSPADDPPDDTPAEWDIDVLFVGNLHPAG